MLVPNANAEEHARAVVALALAPVLSKRLEALAAVPLARDASLVAVAVASLAARARASNSVNDIISNIIVSSANL